jgi:hypothetical protein
VASKPAKDEKDGIIVNQFFMTINGKEYQVSKHPKVIYGPTDLSGWNGKKIADSRLTKEEGEDRIEIIKLEKGQFALNQSYSDTPREKSGQPGDRVTLTLWNRTDTKLFEYVIKDFEQDLPDIHIRLMNSSKTGEEKATDQLVVSSDDLPDMFIVESTDYPITLLVKLGKMHNLDELFPKTNPIYSRNVCRRTYDGRWKCLFIPAHFLPTGRAYDVLQYNSGEIYALHLEAKINEIDRNQEFWHRTFTNAIPIWLKSWINITNINRAII